MNKRAVIAVAATVLTAMAFPAQAQTINICDRTQQVQDEILLKTSTDGDTCDSVSVSEMDNIFSLLLGNKGIVSLKPGDFDNLDRVSRVELTSNELTELPGGIFSSFPLTTLTLDNNAFTALHPLRFYGASFVVSLLLQKNQLNALPAGFFSGHKAPVVQLNLNGNPGALFRLIPRFSSSSLRKNFTTATVKLVLREGAPKPIAVPLLVTGATLSASTLNFTTGSVRSDAVTVTRTPGGEAFELSQGEPIIEASIFSDFEIARGPAVTTASFTHVRARVFLEGALE